MMNYKKFMKNSKAISPIFATLILIAIAVIAGVVVYMFVQRNTINHDKRRNSRQQKMTNKEKVISRW